MRRIAASAATLWGFLKVALLIPLLFSSKQNLNITNLICAPCLRDGKRSDDDSNGVSNTLLHAPEEVVDNAPFLIAFRLSLFNFFLAETLPDMASLAASCLLQNAVQYYTKVPKTGAALKIVE